MIGFGSIGGGEILVILGLALLIFGPRRIPEIGRTIGRTLADFKRASNDFRTSLEREVEYDKVKDAGEQIREARAALRAGETGSSDGSSAASASAPVEDVSPPPPSDAPKHGDGDPKQDGERNPRD